MSSFINDIKTCLFETSYFIELVVKNHFILPLRNIRYMTE